MIDINPKDVLHKVRLLSLLTAIADSSILANNIYFKGGTCASLLGYLDRFSIDLDFDIKEETDVKLLRNKFKNTFTDLNLKIENENKKTLMFVLKYEAPKGQRNSIKLSVFDQIIKSNVYKPQYFAEIDRIVACQTIETMFANKLVAPLDRYQKHEKIAGRDIYDIHHFFSQGYSFRKEVIEERMKMKCAAYIKKLIGFIEKYITETIINEDLNTLLSYDKFKKIRKVLKIETLIFLKNLLTN